MKALKWIAVTTLLVGLSGLLLFTIFRFGQKQGETPGTPIPESMWNVPVTKNRGNTSFRLKDAAQVEGFPISGWVHFNREGQLRTFKLAEDVVIQGNLIPQGTWIRKDKELNIKWCFFQKDTTIQGYLLKGSSAATEGIPTVFYPSGRLENFYSPSDITIQGIPCRNGGFFDVIGVRIHLYENGNLKECTLSKNAEINGRNMLAGSVINISEDGQATIVNDSWKRRTWLRINGIIGN